VECLHVPLYEVEGLGVVRLLSSLLAAMKSYGGRGLGEGGMKVSNYTNTPIQSEDHP